jgi:HEAT repeat protein
VPRLIVALSDENPDIQHEAAITLASIGQPAFAKLEEALHTGGAETKSGAALTLTWIGGKEARAVIERAIEAERDQETLTKLKDALKEMRSRWGNEN